jgi:hypothetical protein
MRCKDGLNTLCIPFEDTSVVRVDTNVYTRGPLVYAGDYNGTVVYVYELKGVPCVQEMTIQTKQPFQFT